MEEKKNNHEVKAEKKYEPLPKKITAFDEKLVHSFQELSTKNNELAALEKQEEQTRMQLINLKKAITDLELEAKVKIEDIIVPWGGFQRHLRKDEKGEFIQHHIDSFHTLENQYTGVIAQRKHREDEFNESSMRTLKLLWGWVMKGHRLQDKELFDKMVETHGKVVSDAGVAVRSNKELDDLIKRAKGAK